MSRLRVLTVLTTVAVVLAASQWCFAASITLVFPIAIGAFDAGILFAFFCCMMCLQLIWVHFMVPETKGVPLEEIQKKLGIQ